MKLDSETCRRVVARAAAVLLILAPLSLGPGVPVAEAYGCVKCNEHSQCVAALDGVCECDVKRKSVGGIIFTVCKESPPACDQSSQTCSGEPPPLFTAPKTAVKSQPISIEDPPVILLLSALMDDGPIGIGRYQGTFEAARPEERGRLSYRFEVTVTDTGSPDFVLSGSLTDTVTGERMSIEALVLGDQRTGHAIVVKPDGTEELVTWEPVRE